MGSELVVFRFDSYYPFLLLILPGFDHEIHDTGDNRTVNEKPSDDVTDILRVEVKVHGLVHLQQYFTAKTLLDSFLTGDDTLRGRHQYDSSTALDSRNVISPDVHTTSWL